MVSTNFREAEGISDAIGVVRRGQHDSKNLTLHDVDSVICQNIDGELDLDVEFTSGHGYHQTSMANCFVLDGLVQGVILVCNSPEASDPDDRPKISLPLNGLEESNRHITIYYNGGDFTKVAYSKALEYYCRRQAKIEYSHFQNQVQASA